MVHQTRFQLKQKVLQAETPTPPERRKKQLPELMKSLSLGNTWDDEAEAGLFGGKRQDVIKQNTKREMGSSHDNDDIDDGHEDNDNEDSDDDDDADTDDDAVDGGQMEEEDEERQVGQKGKGKRKGRRKRAPSFGLQPFMDGGFYTPGLNARGQPIKDEQTVNVFLLAFLSAFTATQVPFHTRWVAERNALVFEKSVKYVARTDGHLRDRNGNSRSLIEVKPRDRGGKRSAIRVQESAQMVAWISRTNLSSHDYEKDCRYSWPTYFTNFPLIVYRIFLLSQDKDKIYLTFPKFGKNYLQGGKKAQNVRAEDFLWMYEFGPFDITSPDHMEKVARFLLAYTNRVAKLQA